MTKDWYLDCEWEVEGLWVRVQSRGSTLGSIVDRNQILDESIASLRLFLHLRGVCLFLLGLWGSLRVPFAILPLGLLIYCPLQLDHCSFLVHPWIFKAKCPFP